MPAQSIAKRDQKSKTICMISPHTIHKFAGENLVEIVAAYNKQQELDCSLGLKGKYKNIVR